MKKLFPLLAVFLASGIFTSALPVNAETSDISLSIDRKEVSLSALQKSNYQVPVFIRISQKVNLNAIEFGVSVDERCRFEVINHDAYAALFGENLNIEMSYASSPGVNGFSWLTWMQSSVYYHEDSSNIALLLVTVPETAAVGDSYAIHYLEQSPINPQKKHLWFNFGTNTNYVLNNSVSWSDGEISITEPEYIDGDVDLNSSVDILDVILLNRYILGKATLNNIQFQAADMDGDGTATPADTLMIMKKIVGIID